VRFENILRRDSKNMLSRSLAVAAFAGCLLTCSACSQVDAKWTKINLRENLVAPAMIPVRTSAVRVYDKSPYNEMEQESAAVFFELVNSTDSDASNLQHHIYRFPSSRESRNVFTDELILGETPADWPQVVTKSDESAIRCNHLGQYYDCTWLGRYSELIVKIRSRVGNNSLSLEQLADVVKAADRQLTSTEVFTPMP
jgi:hypothetical protein